MSFSNKDRDSAKSLTELSPYEIYPYAIHVHAFEDPKHYKEPFRRYKTLAHAKSAVKGLKYLNTEITFYEFEFTTETWEVL